MGDSSLSSELIERSNVAADDVDEGDNVVCGDNVVSGGNVFEFVSSNMLAGGVLLNR